MPVLLVLALVVVYVVGVVGVVVFGSIVGNTDAELPGLDERLAIARAAPTPPTAVAVPDDDPASYFVSTVATD